MNSSFDLQRALPKHIKRLINHHHPIEKWPNNGTSPLYLDKNESRFGTIGSDEEYHLYPDSDATELKTQLAEHKSVDISEIFLGNGSDEVIDILIRSFCTPGKDRVLFFTPTDTRLKRLASLNNVVVDEVELTNFFQLPTYNAGEAVREETKIVFVNNPNPISGICIDKYNVLDLIGVLDLLDDFNGIIVIDESYIDYAEDESLLECIKSYENIIIVQSFSRAWGLAGVRLGTAYGHPELIKVLDIVRPSYNVNVVAQRAAIKALQVPDNKARVVSNTIKERDRMVDVLSQLKFVESVRPSDANFLLVETERSELVLEYLRKEHIVVYDASKLTNCQNCVRITVGKPQDNDEILQALSLLPKKTSPTRIFLKKVSTSLRKASVFLGFFKKFLGS
ncbi:MAG: histidinol-phosphate aminotransferase family protein [Aureispira sp.]|nr:histidinol-phosphate aminotransferase family protein [Aureispira sp.]